MVGEPISQQLSVDLDVGFPCASRVARENFGAEWRLEYPSLTSVSKNGKIIQPKHSQPYDEALVYLSPSQPNQSTYIYFDD